MNTTSGNVRDQDTEVLKQWFSDTNEKIVELQARKMEIVDELKKRMSELGEFLAKDSQTPFQRFDTSQDIRSLELTVGSRNALLFEEISTVANLLEKTEEDLRRIVNIGRVRVNEIKEALAKRGLSLKSYSTVSTPP